jgi:hypothetical protein
MRQTPYFSVRTGQHPDGGRLDLPTFWRLFLGLYREFENQGAFQEYLGYECVDAGYVEGRAGPFPEQFVFRKLRKDHLWPIGAEGQSLEEPDIFDLVEFLHDHTSKGLEGGYHQFANCGWHYRTFDKVAGQREFRDAVNEILRDYSSGYELTVEGEVISRAPAGLRELEAADLPPLDDANVNRRVHAAILKFRRRGASVDERRDAIRDLGDVIEFLRPQAKATLTKKDESDLFELANNFGIRHHNAAQKTNYDRAVWYSWMFYYYLTTINALLHLLERARRKPQ